MTEHLTLPRAIVFDLDGTLIDSRADIARACNHVLQWAGRESLPIETISSFVGDGARNLLARAFGISEQAPEIGALFEEWQRFYVEHPADETKLLPGALRALQELSARGVALGIVTNKARTVTLAIIEAFQLKPYLSALYAGGDGPLKPSPEPIVAIARDLQVSVHELWVVGDGTQDILAARAAGARGIAIAGGFQDAEKLRAAGPDALYESLDAFVDAVSH